MQGDRRKESNMNNSRLAGFKLSAGSKNVSRDNKKEGEHQEEIATGGRVDMVQASVLASSMKEGKNSRYNVC